MKTFFHEFVSKTRNSAKKYPKYPVSPIIAINILHEFSVIDFPVGDVHDTGFFVPFPGCRRKFDYAKKESNKGGIKKRINELGEDDVKC